MSETAEKIAAEWAKLRLAHEATMLEDAQQVLKQQRAAAAQLSAKTLDAPSLAADEGEDESMIHIGDTFNHQPQPQPPAPPPPANSGLSTLAKVGIAAALLATGVGAGVAVPLAISALTDQPAAQTFTDTDTNTNYRLVIPK